MQPTPITRIVTIDSSSTRDETHAFIRQTDNQSDNSLDPVFYTKEHGNEHKRHLVIRLNMPNAYLFIPSPGNTTRIIDKLIRCIANGTLYDIKIRETIFPFLAEFLNLKHPDLEELIRQRAIIPHRLDSTEITMKLNFLRKTGIMRPIDLIYYAAKSRNKVALTHLLNGVRNTLSYFRFNTPIYRLAFEGDLDTAVFLKQEFGGRSDDIARGLIHGKHFTKAVDFLNSAKDTVIKNKIISGMLLGYATIGSFEKCFELLESLPNQTQKETSKKINFCAAFGGHEKFVNRALSTHALSNTIDLAYILSFYAMGGHVKKALDVLSLIQDITLRKNAFRTIAMGCTFSDDIIQDNHPIWAFALNDGEKLCISLGIAVGYASQRRPEYAIYVAKKTDKIRPIIERAMTHALLDNGYLLDTAFNCSKSTYLDLHFITSSIIPKIEDNKSLQIFLYELLATHPNHENLKLSDSFLHQDHYQRAMIALDAEIHCSNGKSSPEHIKRINDNIHSLLKNSTNSKNHSYDFIKFAINPINCSQKSCEHIQAQLIKITTEPTVNSIFSLFSSENSDNKLYSFYLHLLLQRDAIIKSNKSLDQTIIAMAKDYQLPAAAMELLQAQVKPLPNIQDVNNSESKHDDTPSIETIASIVTTPPNKHPYLKIRAIDSAEDKLDELDKTLEWGNDVKTTPNIASNTR